MSRLLTYPEGAAEVMWHLVTCPEHGYSQPNRAGDGTIENLTLSDGTEVSIPGGDKDCSEGIRVCYAAVGVLDWDYWTSYMWTGNEDQMLTSAGFVTVDKWSAQVGDVLWRSGHTEMVIEVDGQLMQAGFRRSEYYSTTGQQGDQDGGESTYSTYDAGAWTRCYRYQGAERDGASSDGSATVGAEGEDNMGLACIVTCADNHEGYSKGMMLLWTPMGIEYINDYDSVKLLDDISTYYTGKPLKRVESSSKAPWIIRLQQVTIGSGQNEFGKVR